VPVQPVVAPASKGPIPQPVSMSAMSVGSILRERQVASRPSRLALRLKLAVARQVRLT
jgi:hypothetical protein